MTPPGPPAPAAPVRHLALGMARLSRWVPDRLFRLGLGEEPALLVIATLIGLLTGGAVLGFYQLLTLAGRVAQATEAQLTLPAFWVHAAVLGLGIGLARLLVRLGTADSPGENVPALMLAVARHGGRLPIRAILIKTVAAGLVIGTGGSVGAEGPVAVLGAGTANAAGRWLRLSAERFRLLVACGAGAGIAGAFGAPIAGLFFAVEKLFGGTRNASLAPLVVASVTAAAVTRTVLGSHSTLLHVPTLHAGWTLRDLLLSVAVGVAGGGMAALYSRGVWWGRDLLARVSIPARVLLAAGLVAFLYTLVPASLLGVGTLELGDLASHGALLLLGLAAAKIAATALTLGASEVGGLFAPAIVAGALTGAGLGQLLQQAGVPLPLGTTGYALLGMAALLAGSTHAPLTAIFVVLELSGDWTLILPLLVAGARGHVTARRLWRESVYSEWLARRGEARMPGADEGLLGRLKVGTVYERAPVVLTADSPLAEAEAALRAGPRLEYPVVDGEGALVGMLSLEAWHQLRLEPSDGARLVRDLAGPVGATVTEEDSLLTALRRMGGRDAPLLPVVRPHDHHLLGVIGRREIFAAYEAALGGSGG